MVKFPVPRAAFMSGRSDGVEVWGETTEEVVVTEEDLLPEHTTAEPVGTPIQRLLDTVGHGDNAEDKDAFYKQEMSSFHTQLPWDCDECLTLFQDQSDPANSSGPFFILDFPTVMGVPQRALLTLPHGLTVGRSSIPSAGVGVINHGPIIPLGMHFGPYEGEVASLENSITSGFSWEICKGNDTHEYIDAARESHSNWMRYVNSARNKDETNLLAVQYKGSILFHCCRAIHPGDELMVWPSSRLLAHFSKAWSQLWSMKLNAAESKTVATSPVFACSHCPLSFTTESFLQRHRDRFHGAAQPTESVGPENPACGPDPGTYVDSLVVLSIDPVKSKTCSDCGKVFKQVPHLNRHKLCVHATKRPYCCPHCKRSFSQASGLIRHQRVHRSQAVIKDTDVTTEASVLAEEESLTPNSEPATITEESKDVNGSGTPDEALNATGTECVRSQSACSDSSKSFTNEESLKEVNVQKTLRPYVCIVCHRSFRQYCELSRHLLSHQKTRRRGERKNSTPDESAIRPFSCGDCSQGFSSVDDLQRHINEHHSVESMVENQTEAPVPGGDDQSHDPDFSPQSSVAGTLQKEPSQRPERLGVRSKISAITRLIAPKRRAARRNSPLPNASRSETSSNKPEAPAAKSVKLTKYKWYSCNRCKHTYANPEELKVHRCAVGQHRCAQCGMTFSKSGSLTRHEQTAHAGAKSYSCDSCEKSFCTSAKLKRHQRTDCRKHRYMSELFSCTFCPFSFTMKNYLIKHIKRHHPVEYVSLCDSGGLGDLQEEDKERVCPHCQKSFASTKALKAHSCFQRVKVLYLCTDCGKGFANHYGLKQHQRVHTGEKPYSCPHCSKSFSYAGQLNVHLRTHTGEKPYLCTHCGESFRQSGDLKRHERKHTGVRPYSCSECCKSFSRLQSLKAHQMLHQGQRMFKCTQCGKSFSRNYHLRRHHQKMHQ